MKKTLPPEAAAFPESPRLTRRSFFSALAATAAAPLAALAQQQPTSAIRSLRTTRSLAGAGSDVVIEVVSTTPFYQGANGWILVIGKRQFGNYTYGPKGEMNILQYRVPAAEFSRLATGEAASVHYGDPGKPGRSLGRLNRSLLSR
jgi:hypothetical protein